MVTLQTDLQPYRYCTRSIDNRCSIRHRIAVTFLQKVIKIFVCTTATSSYYKLHAKLYAQKLASFAVANGRQFRLTCLLVITNKTIAYNYSGINRLQSSTLAKWPPPVYKPLYTFTCMCCPWSYFTMTKPSAGPLRDWKGCHMNVRCGDP